jgi:hypothetical protein
MGLSTGLTKLSRLSLLSLLPTSIYASTLFSRQDSVCGGIQNLNQCGNDFPSEFCCPKDTACKRLNSNEAVSVICCPDGADCAFIQPITCDIEQFDAKLHPDNQIHLSTTTGIELPKCGEKCCPVGYSCNGKMCKADPDTSATPSSTSSSTPSPTSTPSASQTTEALPVTAESTQRGFDGKSFVAGFFPGIVIGALGTIGLIWVIKKRRESQERNRYSGDFGDHVARTISDPIYDPVYAARTDFIRRGSTSAQPSPKSTTPMVQKSSTAQTSARGGMTPKLKSLWERTPKLGFGGFSELPATPAPAVRAGNNRDPYKTPTRTPTRSTSISRSASISRSSSLAVQPVKQMKPQRPLAGRSGSTETIDVLMRPPSFLAPPKAPGMRENRFTQDSGQTTFTKLMERAGFEEESRQSVRNWKGSPARAI